MNNRGVSQESGVRIPSRPPAFFCFTQKNPGLYTCAFSNAQLASQARLQKEPHLKGSLIKRNVSRGREVTWHPKWLQCSKMFAEAFRPMIALLERGYHCIGVQIPATPLTFFWLSLSFEIILKNFSKSLSNKWTLYPCCLVFPCGLSLVQENK